MSIASFPFDRDQILGVAVLQDPGGTIEGVPRALAELRGVAVPVLVLEAEGTARRALERAGHHFDDGVAWATLGSLSERESVPRRIRRPLDAS